MRTEVTALAPLVRLTLPGMPELHNTLEVRLAGEMVCFRTLPNTTGYLHGSLPAALLLAVLRELRLLYRHTLDGNRDMLEGYRRGYACLRSTDWLFTLRLDADQINASVTLEHRQTHQQMISIIPVQMIPLLRRAFCALHTFWILKEDF